MNTKTYSEMIAKEFGGFRKDELKKKLDKLILLAKSECFKKPEKKTKKPLLTNNQQIINNSMNHYSQKNDIERVNNIINSSITLGTWIALESIPNELFRVFNSILQIRKDIIFDEERGNRFFKAVKNDKQTLPADS